VKNFDWEEWRKRYLKFNNNKKSRVQDFFRKLDEDGDGYCPRDEFIDGILKARIETKNSLFGKCLRKATVVFIASFSVFLSHLMNVSEKTKEFSFKVFKHFPFLASQWIRIRIQEGKSDPEK
jgi:hypothetical protein